jgi:hypothetical protein
VHTNCSLSRTPSVACCGVVALLAIAVLGCGSETSRSSGGAYGGSSAGTAGGSADSSPSGSGGVGGLVIPDAAGGRSDSGEPSDASCGGLSVLAKKIQVDLFVMFDVSRGMSCPVPSAATRLDTLRAAIGRFVALPEAEGLGFGIGYFGLDHGSCNEALYASADVEIAPLPGNATAIVSSLAAQNPGSTWQVPIFPALTGAIQHARQWAASHRGHTVAVVLVMSSEAGLLCGDLSAVNGAAAQGMDGTPPIRSYVLGIYPEVNCGFPELPFSQAALDAIALSGGTTRAILVRPETDFERQFLDAIQQIQERVSLPCSYAIPPPSSGETFDFYKVNVRFTPGSGLPTDILSAGTREQCTANGGGWYYDEPAHPNSIELCPETCNLVSRDTGGKIDIVLGCEPKGIPPPIPR